MSESELREPEHTFVIQSCADQPVYIQADYMGVDRSTGMVTLFTGQQVVGAVCPHPGMSVVRLDTTIVLDGLLDN